MFAYKIEPKEMSDKGENRGGSRRKTSKKAQDGGAHGGNPRGSLKEKVPSIDIPCSQVSHGMMEDEERENQHSVTASITCKECQQAFVDEQDKLIECDRCKFWECLECSGMDQKLYESLNDDTVGPYIHWYCRKCKEPAMKAVSTDNEIEVRCEQFFAKFRAEIHEEIDAVKRDIENLKSESRNQKNEMSTLKSELEVKSQLTVEQAIKEVQDRQERKLNVVFFNIDESEADEIEQAKQDDLAELRKILDQIEAKVPIANPTRLGKKEDSVTARPLRVRAANEQDVAKIMSAAKKLKGHADLGSVYINRDRTPLERQEWKRLLEEKKERNEEARNAGREENWIIRKQQVILGRPKDK